MIPIYQRKHFFDHKHFLSFIAQYITPTHYLELGVLNGEVFKEIASHSIKATAVDVRDIEFKLPDNAVYYQGTTDSYFKTLHTDVKFDMVFIDADHSYEQSLKDFINIEKYVVDDGFIFLHDTYPHTEEFLDPSICGDTYKTAHYIKSYMSDDFEILTLPFSPGITVVKKIKKSKQLIWV